MFTASGSRWERLNAPSAVAALAAIAYLSFCTARLTTHDLSTFVLAGDRFCDPARTPEGLAVYRDSDGYDGEFYYRLALDPFTSQRTAHGITLDKPPYRHQRIVLPLLAWALSGGGSPALVPGALVAVNVLAVAVLGWLAGAYVARSAPPGVAANALWGLAIPFYPGFLISLSLDLTEILACDFLLASLLTCRSNPRQTALWLTLAVLTRETTILAAAAMLIDGAIARRQAPEALPSGRFRSGPEVASLLPPCAAIASFALWQAWLTLNWGEFSAAANRENWLAVPGQGYLESVYACMRPWQWARLAQASVVACYSALAILSWRTSQAPRMARIAWLLYAGLVFSLHGGVYANHWAFLRVHSECFLFAALIVLADRSAARKAALAVVCSIAWLLACAERLEWLIL